MIINVSRPVESVTMQEKPRPLFGLDRQKFSKEPGPKRKVLLKTELYSQLSHRRISATGLKVRKISPTYVLPVPVERGTSYSDYLTVNICSTFWTD